MKYFLLVLVCLFIGVVSAFFLKKEGGLDVSTQVDSNTSDASVPEKDSSVNSVFSSDKVSQSRSNKQEGYMVGVSDQDGHKSPVDSKFVQEDTFEGEKGSILEGKDLSVERNSARQLRSSRKGSENVDNDSKDVKVSEVIFQERVQELRSEFSPEQLGAVEFFLDSEKELPSSRELDAILATGKTSAEHSAEARALISRLDLDEERSTAVQDVFVKSEQSKFLAISAFETAISTLLTSDEGFSELRSDIESPESDGPSLPQSTLELSQNYYSELTKDGDFLPFESSSLLLFSNGFEDEAFISSLSDAVGSENSENLQQILDDFTQVALEKAALNSAATEALSSGLSNEQKIESFTSEVEENSKSVLGD